MRVESELNLGTQEGLERKVEEAGCQENYFLPLKYFTKASLMYFLSIYDIFHLTHIQVFLLYKEIYIL